MLIHSEASTMSVNDKDVSGFNWTMVLLSAGVDFHEQLSMIIAKNDNAIIETIELRVVFMNLF